jgi:hypothetical protein
MGAPNCNLHLNISELHLQYFRVLPVKYNYICSDNSVAWTAFHVQQQGSAINSWKIWQVQVNLVFRPNSPSWELAYSWASVTNKCLQFVLYEKNIVMCALMLHAFQIVPISGEDFWESWEKSHFTEGPEESNLLKSLLQHKFVSTTSTRIRTHILPRKVKTLYCYYSQVSSGDHPTPSQPSRTTKAQCSTSFFPRSSIIMKNISNN